MFRTLREDWRAYNRPLLAQGFWALRIHRFGAARRPFRNPLIRLPWGAVHLVLMKLGEVFCGIYLGKDARIGRRLVIEHFGAIIVHNRAVIGDDCVLRQGVTIGMRHTSDPLGVPVLGDRVDVGAGAKLLGRIVIGDDAVIGANAVVLDNVPAGALAVGVPAVIKRRRGSAPGSGTAMQREAEREQIGDPYD
jgi:serine O-acetyltransferase